MGGGRERGERTVLMTRNGRRAQPSLGCSRGGPWEAPQRKAPSSPATYSHSGARSHPTARPEKVGAFTSQALLAAASASKICQT